MTDLPPSIGSTLRDYLKQLFNFRMVALLGGLQVNRSYPKSLNEICNINFMSGSLTDGRTFRVLNVIDDYNRQCLLTQGSISLPAERDVRHLEELIEHYGKSRFARTDYDSEFTANVYKKWYKERK